jgi:leader peptidase (prepilin peptidase)/N-methyltransferase
MLETLTLILGLCVGSFLNVCIVRVPNGMSVVTPPSHCPQCDRTLKWYENLPIISYLMLRGRCRGCALPIPVRYPLVESLTGLLAVLVARAAFTPLEACLYFLLGCAMIVVTFIDIDHYIIPDAITLPSIIVAPAAAFVVHHISVMDSLIGILAGGGILWAVAWAYQALRKQEGMGFGDVKLLAMVGGFLGWEAVLFTLLVGSLVGSLIGLAMILGKRAGLGMEIPFGPFLAFGAMLYVFNGPALIGVYLDLPNMLF